jgi:hypothetical protein
MRALQKEASKAFALALLLKRSYPFSATRVA